MFKSFTDRFKIPSILVFSVEIPDVFVTICAIKSAPPNTVAFLNVPVISIFPSANRPSIAEVLLPLLPLGSCDYVSDFHVSVTYPSKSEPVHLIEPAVSIEAFPTIIAPLV